MAINIQELNQRQAQIRETKRAERIGDPFVIYETRKTDKTRFNITFTSSDPEGNLYFADQNGIWLKLPIAALQASDQYYDRLHRGNYIGIKELEVMVDEINYEEKMVILKSGRTTENIVNGVRKLLEARCKAAYEARKRGEQLEPYDIYGTVSYVDKAREYAFVNILGKNIRGVIHVSEWSSGFMRQLPEGIEDTNEPVHFDLIGTMRIDGKKFFRLSTRRFGCADWDNLPKHIREGGLVTVTCTDTSNPKYWYGLANGFSTEWRGNYTDKFKIQVGRQYNVTLKRVESGDHAIWMVPFKYIRPVGEPTENESFSGDVGLTKDDLRRLLEEKKAKKKNEKEN